MNRSNGLNLSVLIVPLSFLVFVAMMAAISAGGWRDKNVTAQPIAPMGAKSQAFTRRT